MIDLEIYNKNNKTLKHRQGLTWIGARQWLEHTIPRTPNLYKIEIRIFTSEGMPVDSALVNNFDEAYSFLKMVFIKAKKGEYKGVWME